MGALRIELVLSEVEELAIFDSDNEYLISELSVENLAAYNNFFNLVGENFITLDGIIGDDLVVYRKKLFTHNENYELDAMYSRVITNYSDYSTEEKNIIDAFVALINALK